MDLLKQRPLPSEVSLLILTVEMLLKHIYANYFTRQQMILRICCFHSSYKGYHRKILLKSTTGLCHCFQCGYYDEFKQIQSYKTVESVNEMFSQWQTIRYSRLVSLNGQEVEEKTNLEILLSSFIKYIFVYFKSSSISNC